MPQFPFRLKEESGTIFIFDEVRRKFLVLTPEEWVRQHFVQFLIRQKNYPKGLIGLEGGLKLNSLQKRSDIVLFNAAGNKTLLVECKAPSVKISQATFDQVARYNVVHQVSFLAVTNGLQHYFCEVDFGRRSYKFIEELPMYTNGS
nr:type I restriction enzyme HsdR N-terminal domain-containing protein [Hufsiella ginkgonis]